MSAARVKSLSLLIKEKAVSLGFDLCGIAPSRPLIERRPVIQEWCTRGMNDEMSYLGKSIEKRLDPDFLFPGAKSVIVTGLNYYTSDIQEMEDVPVLSRYAFGADYHYVIKKKLEFLLEFIKNSRSEAEGRSIVDSAPLLEKAWAVEAGLGWQGRHSIVINNKIGSFFFIGIIILNIELDYDKPFKGSRCGSCRLCIEQCPTTAINEDGTIDARKCIANLTIENRGPIPEDLVPKLGRRVFGCDRCQEVCPWNKIAESCRTSEFNLSPELKRMTKEDWQNLTKEQFDRLFENSPVRRRKYEPLMQNVTIVTNSGS